MAMMTFSGTDGLIEAFNRISDIPWEVTEEALDAMGDVAAREIKSSGEAYGVRDENSDVHILDKITQKKAKQTDDGGTKAITFDGSRRRGNSSTRNAEIAFINEYGKRGQSARPFIKKAIEGKGDEISAPAEKIVGEWLENEFTRN